VLASMFINTAILLSLLNNIYVIPLLVILILPIIFIVGKKTWKRIFMQNIKQKTGILDKQQAFGRIFLQSSPAFFVAINGEGKTIMMSDSMLTALGYKAKEVEDADYLTTFVPKKDHLKLSHIFEKLTTSGDSTLNENHVLTKDGREILVEWHGRPVFSENGDLDFFFGIGVDITMRKQAEKALRESEQKFRAIFDQTYQFIGLLDIDGVLLEANETALEFAGLKGKDVIGKSFWEAPWWRHSPELQNKIRDGIKMAASGEFVRFEVNNPGPDGKLHYVDFSLKPVKDENGNVIFLIPEGRDITDRIIADEALKISEAKFQDLYDNAPDMYVSVNPEDSSIIQCNQTLADKLGYDKEEIIGKPIFSVYHPDCLDDVKEAFQKFVDTGEVQDTELQLVCKDGSKIDVSLNVSAVRDKNGKILHSRSAWRDITKRTQTEERIRQLSSLEEDLLKQGSLMEKAEHITDGVVKIFNADFARIWITRPGDLCGKGCIHAKTTKGPHVCIHREKCLHLISSSGRYTHIDGETHRRVPFDCYKIGRVASGEDAGFLTNDVINDPRIHDHNWARQLGLASFAGYKLQSSDGSIIGVLALFSKNVISPEENAILGTIAGITSQMIQVTIAEEEVKQSEERYALAQKVANVGSWDWNILTDELFWSEQMEPIFGLAVGEFDRSYKTFLDYIYPEDRQYVINSIEACISDGKDYNVEFRIIRPDGSVRWVSETGNIFRDKKGKAVRMIGIVQDTTTRKHTDQEILKVNRMLQILSECNIALVHTYEENELLQKICQIIVEIGEYPLVWIGFAENDKEKTVRPVAQMGHNCGYLDSITISWADTEYGRGPTGTAIRSGKTCIAENISEEPNYSPWRENALNQGFASSIAIPLRANSSTIGAINIYANVVKAFHEEEVELLEQLANDLAFGIIAIRNREKREQAEKKIQEQSEFLRSTIDSLSHPFYVIDANDFTIKMANTAAASPELLDNKITCYELIHGVDKPCGTSKHRCPIEEIKRTKEPVVIEHTHYDMDNNEQIVEVQAHPIFDENGDVIQVIEYRHDITERKKAEEELIRTNRSLEEERGIFIGGPAVIFKWKNSEGWPVEYVSPNVVDVMGYTASEFISGKVPYAEIISEEDLERVTNEVITNSNSGVIHFEHKPYRIMCKGGKMIWIVDYTSILRDKNGQITHYLGYILDITRRIEAEQKLSIFKDFVDVSSLGHGFSDLEGNIIYINSALRRMLGVASIEYAVGKNVDSYYPENDREKLINDILPTVIGLGQWVGELPLLSVDGKVTPTIQSISLIRNSDGLPLYIGNVITDITERKQAEEALLFKEDIIDSASSVIATADLDGNMTYTNPAFLRIWGFEDTNDIYGKQFWEFWMVEDRMDEIMFALSNEGKWTDEIKARKKDGTLFDVHVLATVVRDKNGNPISLMSSSVDITERKKIEERFRLAAQVSSDLIYEWDIKSDTLAWFGNFEKSLGYALGEIPHTIEAWVKLIHPDDIVMLADAVEYHRNSTEPIFYEYRVKRKDGAWRYWSDFGTPILNDEGRPCKWIGTCTDITERKQAEEALRCSEERYALAQKTGNIGSWDWDIISNNLHWSEQIEPMFGFTQGQFGATYDAFLECVHPEDRQSVIDSVNESVDEDKEYNIEHRIIWPDGTVKWISETGSVFRDDDDKAIRMLGVVQDITERKVAEKQREANLYFFKSLEQVNRVIQQASDLEQMLWDTIRSVFSIFGCDRIWLFYPCDPNAQTFQIPVEYTRSEYPGVIDKNIDLPMKPGADTVCAYVLKSNIPVTFGPDTDNPIYKELTDQFGVLSMLATAIYPKIGKPWMFGMHQCSHARVWSQNEQQLFGEISRRLSDALSSMLLLKDLQESEERYRTLIETAGEGVWIVDNNTLTTFTNHQMAEMLGYTVEEMLFKPVSTFLDEENAAKFMEKVSSRINGKGEQYDLCFRCKDGSNLWGIVNACPIFDSEDQVTGSFGMISDITMRKKMEEELAKSAKLESIGTLAGGIAHDFNNILSAILGNVSLAKMYIDSGSKLFEFIDQAEKAALRAGDLTQQLLTFSKGGAPILETTSIEEVIRDSSGFAVRGSKSKCEFNIPRNLHNVRADAGQISQVINNLVMNADHSMPDGGVIQITAKNIAILKESKPPLKEGEYVKVSVEDSGVGIPHDNLQKIFDPFFTTKEQGNGLGLSSCYSIIKKHQGHISVDSQEGIGSIFNLYLPATESKATIKKKVDDVLVEGSGRILVLDDDESVRNLANAILSRLGYEVHLTDEGSKAITLYRKAGEAKQPFDAVIVDLTIPGGLGGREVIKKLCKIDPDVKAVVSSGYSTDPIMSDFKTYGFQGRISKPYQAGELSRVIKEVLQESGKSNDSD
jgi:PAS domain S-box-containing protein